MTPRERVLKTFAFEPTDRAPFDLMEGMIWGELMQYFRERHGLQEGPEVIDLLDTDFRWLWIRYEAPETATPPPVAPPQRDHATHTCQYGEGPLSGVETVKEVESHPWPDPSHWKAPDCEDARRRWPDHALVFSAGWKPLFWSACEAFGFAEALAKMASQPEVFEAFVRRQHEFYMDLFTRGLKAARGYCDICWLGDDYASQKAMMMSPDSWRRLIKPYLAEQVRLAREHGLLVLFHSCGSVRPILPDLIDIGVNALLVFQITAAEMDVESIAREFGGKLAFYGGIDVQQLLSFGTVEEVRQTVRANVRAFAQTGGYIVANSHHGVATIKGENVIVMCEEARQCMSPREMTA